MSWLVSVLITVSLVLQSPAAWLSPENGWGYLVRSSGCTATLILSDQVTPIESFFDVDEDGPFIFLGVSHVSEYPGDVVIMILLHETGHCLQYQAGMLGDYRSNPKKYELDADRLSADLACRAGMDGRRMLRELFEWAKRAVGYDGDRTHGTSVERIAQGNLARSCDVRGMQAP